MLIREYKNIDREQLKHLIAELQDYHAKFIPGMISGKEMANNYLDKFILDGVVKKDGRIFVADNNGQLVGYVWVYIENEPRDLMYTKSVNTALYIGDYLVTKNSRATGIGKKLFSKVQEFAKEKGINEIKLHVDAKNILARQIYSQMGFSEDEIILIKNI